MTLMYSMIAARQSALRSGALECWPVGTIHTRDDVVINGASLAQWSTTPAVRIGAAGGFWGAQTSERFVTVVLTAVEEVRVSGATGRREVWVDAELHHCTAIFSAARLIGRASKSRRERMQLQPHSTHDQGWARLPGDIVAGDLIAIPCEGTTPLASVRRHDHHPERVAGDRLGDGDDDFPFLPACLK